jgi:hypothetical protein
LICRLKRATAVRLIPAREVATLTDPQSRAVSESASGSASQ